MVKPKIQAANADAGTNRPCTSGFTLVELMVGVLLGSLLLALALQLLAQGRAAWHTAEDLADLNERAAFALTLLEQDLLHAGYWGLHSDSAQLIVPDSIAVRCRGSDVSSWALQLDIAVGTSDGNFDLPCPAATRAVPGSDTLTLRHADPAVALPETGSVQLQTTTQGGTLFNDGTPPASPATDARIHNVAVHAWYVDAASSEANRPALRRYALVRGGLMQNEEVMPGVEDLQVALGVDRDGDGVLDGFVDPGRAPGASVIAVRVWLLLRAAQPEAGYFDNGPWYSIDADATLPRRPGDGYRRAAMERTVWLRNSGAG